MARQPTRLILFAFLALALAAAGGGRTIEAGPGYGGDDGEGGAAAGGGTSTSSGTGGTGGTTSSGTGGGTAGTGGTTSSGTGGTGGTSPLDCIGCIMTTCPQALDCVTDPNCLQGVVCAVSDCLAGGQPDLMCVVGCFDGDMGAAMSAIDALMCIMGDCADECGSMLPF